MRSLSAVIGLLAMVGFAGAANAAVTIDLLWGGTDTGINLNTNTSSTVTLQVVLTNEGPDISQGGGVTVDYSEAGGELSVVSFQNFVGVPLELSLGVLIDTGTQIQNINAAAFVPFVGSGLGVGDSYLLGTVQFQNTSTVADTFSITAVLVNTDGFTVFPGGGADTPTTNAAQVTVVPEPETIASVIAAATALAGLGWYRRRE